MYFVRNRRFSGMFNILVACGLAAAGLISGCSRPPVTAPPVVKATPIRSATTRPYGRMKRLTAADFLHSQMRGFVFGDGNEDPAPYRNFALTGANMMRVFINVNRNYKGTAYVLTPQLWRRMNVCAAMGDRYHFRVVFVLGVNQARLWNSAKLQAGVVDVWGKIAAHFKGRRSIAGFDILNEPAAAYASKGGYAAWRTFAIAIIKRIRQVDSSRICIVETPPYWATTYVGTVWGQPIKPRPYARFVHLPFSNLVYSFHLYEPLSISMQGLPGYPGVHPYPTKTWNYKTLFALVKPVKAFQDKYHVTIYVGEFSCIRWAPDGSAVRYVHDCLRIFTKEGWSWTYHAFDEYNGWNPELPQNAPRQLPDGLPVVNFKPWISARTPMMKMIEQYLRWDGGVVGQTIRAADAPPQSAATGRPFRILCVGDSITQEGVVKSLGWNHISGMAATSVRKDYAHLLAAYVQRALPQRRVVLNLASPHYGQSTLAGYLAPLKAFAKKHPPASYDLIVLQHGEHAKFNRLALFRKLDEDWMRLFAESRHPIVICVGVWQPSIDFKAGRYIGWTGQIENTERQLCGKFGGYFVSVATVAGNPRNHGWGTNGGVQWHPNDRGHELYAIKIFRRFQRVAAARGLKLHPVALPKLKP